jgi:hypothetical protein
MVQKVSDGTPVPGRQVIEDEHSVAETEQRLNQMAADESSPASYERGRFKLTHGCVSLGAVIAGKNGGGSYPCEDVPNHE